MGSSPPTGFGLADRPDPSFGSAGWAPVTGLLSPGPDPAITDVLEIADGPLLVEVTGGNSGEYHIWVATLSPSGQPDPQFSDDVQKAWQYPSGNASFFGNIFSRGTSGFGVLGYWATYAISSIGGNGLGAPAGFPMGSTPDGNLGASYGHDRSISCPGAFQGETPLVEPDGSVLDVLNDAYPDGSRPGLVVGPGQLTSQGFIAPAADGRARVAVLPGGRVTPEADPRLRDTRRAFAYAPRHGTGLAIVDR